MGVAPMLAPTSAARCCGFTNWRGVFVVLAVLALLLIVVAWRGVRETLPRGAPAAGAACANTVRTYGGLLRDRTFVGLVAGGRAGDGGAVRATSRAPRSSSRTSTG